MFLSRRHLLRFLATGTARTALTVAALRVAAAAATTSSLVVPATNAAADTAMTVLHAGSMNNLVQQGLAPATQRDLGLKVLDVAGNSVFLANSIKDGSKTGDLFMSADAGTNALLTGDANGDWVRWFAVFARNSVVIGYSPKSRFAADFAAAQAGTKPWYEVLAQPGVKLMRNDPNLDPLGYYALFVCQLAETYYGVPGLKQQVLGADTNPQQVGSAGAAMLASVEIDAAFLYLNGAADANAAYLTLPDAISLSNPDYADSYASASYTTPTGQTFQGAPIRFSIAPLTRAAQPDAAEQFLEYLLSPAGQAIATAYHFLPSPILLGGNTDAAPDAVKALAQGTYTG